MFEIAELGHSVTHAVYKKKAAVLRTNLLEVQDQLKAADFPVIILISGVDGGGKGEIINCLNQWLDPHYMHTVAFSELSDEERQRPNFWRFWRTMPARGAISIYVGSWYSVPISRRMDKKIDDAELQIQLNRINRFEQLFTDDGALIIKCWLHLKKDRQLACLKALSKDPATQWRVTEKDKQHLAMYDEFIGVAEQVLTATSAGDAPWLIVDGSDVNYSRLTVGQYIFDRIDSHLKTVAKREPKKADHQHLHADNILDALDLSLSKSKKTYKTELEAYQGRLNKLSRATQAAQRSSILVFEGWDAAGKGGAIRRLTEAMDARYYQVIPVAKPSVEESRYHYLWRFWRDIPRAGHVTIFDRSWYGRVLVERVEGLAGADAWRRAYAEIVDFEENLLGHGTGILKFWLQIDRDEQMRRFKAREKISYKHFKISAEDYRNREKWHEYEIAVNDMITRTSTAKSPWLLIEANDKYYARIKIIKAYCELLEKMLDGAED